ncbi:UNKNOWN [Stylonychia lemnae]|uniref:Spindle assembly abnormal protein 6 N-terminal domain-containing protein n=1 Tax=Stylonychia lemnae TaxID=5949 RepID=A0A077ZVR5_STYLE|nr:UNKNOWN [Stylonychia lemnae]|eukprot:CDW73335.1 UNKNOWN [Stylonychia lemnae]
MILAFVQYPSIDLPIKQLGDLEQFMKEKFLWSQRSLSREYFRWLDKKLAQENQLHLKFCYKVDLQNFEELKKELKLKINFSDYATMLIKMLNNCIKDQNIYQLAQFQNKLTNQRLTELAKIIKLKNPSLLNQIQKVGDTTKSQQYLRTNQPLQTYGTQQLNQSSQSQLKQHSTQTNKQTQQIQNKS